MLQITSERKIFVYREPLDMRKSFQGLIAATRFLLKEDPLSGSLFLFINKKRNYIKILFWDRSGYVLYAKKLERGKFKVWLDNEKQCISERQLSFLLDGIPVGRRAHLR